MGRVNKSKSISDIFSLTFVVIVGIGESYCILFIVGIGESYCILFIAKIICSTKLSYLGQFMNMLQKQKKDVDLY